MISPSFSIFLGMKRAAKGWHSRFTLLKFIAFKVDSMFR